MLLQPTQMVPQLCRELHKGRRGGGGGGLKLAQEGVY